MPFIESNGQKVWIPRMSPKGYRVMACDRRYILLHGARKTTKSNTCQNMLINHAWKHDGATVGVFSRILKSGAEGCYNDLTKRNGRMSEWIASGIGIQYTKEPTFERDTQMRYFRIRNRHGGESEIQLHSIDREDKVAERYKDMRFSMIYLIEADRFESQDTFLMLTEQLRVEGIDYKDHQAILDTNPPVDGEENWLYKTFIYNEAGEYVPDVNKRFAEFNFTMDDNPFIPQEEKDDIFDKWKHNPEKLDRFYYGKWTKSTQGSVFCHQFRPQIHVIGDVSPPDRSQHTLLLPEDGCWEFPSGWDLGDAMNHAFVIGCKRMVGDLPVIDIIDEWVTLNDGVNPEVIASQFLRKRHYWTQYMKSRGKETTVWREWSDSSSLRYIAAARGSMAGELERVSEGVIRLVGVEKRSGSVATRVELLKRLLHEQRVFVSASCKHTIDMLSFIRSGKAASEVIDPRSKYKHVFDALTYMLSYELSREISMNRNPREERAPIISV